jgi:hypothetical protein
MQVSRQIEHSLTRGFPCARASYRRSLSAFASCVAGAGCTSLQAGAEQGDLLAVFARLRARLVASLERRAVSVISDVASACRRS